MAKETKKVAAKKDIKKKETIKKPTAKKNIENTKKANAKSVKKDNNKKITSKRTQGQEVMKRIETSKGKEAKKMGIILACVLIILGLFYLIAGVATGSIDLSKNEPAQIQYSQILAGSTFKQSTTEYIVLYYDYTQEKNSDYANLISSYESKESHLTVYTVDLSRKFNSSYIANEGETTNPNPTSASELKVKDPTLIVIKDKKVEKYLENYEDIENYMS